MQARFGQLILVLLLAAGLSCGRNADPKTGPAASGKIKLAVIVVFDQLRGDYLGRWEKLFGEGGFRRLMTKGAWFQNCHYPYAYTLTAPGHASLVTGTSPYKHGIVGNEWYDRESGEIISSVESAKHRPVPAPVNPRIIGTSPFRRRQPSVGDVLLEATMGKSKIVSLSIKDRAAMLLAALRALCYWFSTNAGTFVTSTYYEDSLRPWVGEFNRGRMADQWFGKEWTRLLPELDYAKFSSPADNPFGGIGVLQGQSFPHRLDGGAKKITQAYYQAMINSPYGNQLLLALAKKAIDAERLGQNDSPDLLCLSFSSNDSVGHCWGPDSQEVLDITLHSDRIVKELLNTLDAKVGKGNYLLVLSADHGICPIPEVAQKQGKKAGRVSPQLLTTDALAFLNETFSKSQKLPWIEEVVGDNIYLNRGVLREQGLESATVEKALAGWIAKQPGILGAYTHTQLSKGPIADDAIAESVRLSFHPEASGDVLVVLQPYHLLSPPISAKLAAYRTTHGSPHHYDTHVPLLVYGPGVRAGIREERITPQVAAAILAHGLDIPPPPGAEAPLPKGLFDD
jgi:predicted AlkP superfamily pyrophosphatase or phosphodiesterase